MSRRLTSALLITATLAGLGYANLEAATQPIDTTAVAQAPETQAPPVADVAVEPDKVRTLEEFSETVSRPLFNDTRRPTPPRAMAETPPQDATVQATAGNTPVRATLRLLGTMQAGARGPRALIQADAAARADWVDIGADVSGWRVTSIRGDTVSVEADGAQSEIKLYPRPQPVEATK